MTTTARSRSDNAAGWHRGSPGATVNQQTAETLLKHTEALI